MTAWLPTLALLACPVGMGAMMFFMMRGNRQSGPDPREQEVVQLRAEIDQLRSELRDERPAGQESRP
ncbi:DUF2933 domain-containing protein [Nonomuraea sp. M3C6]|uniref:DUF2933 domain-containing protein n=1 Tax=Nonomuraea marmarensis TaxID=3351344 RepID=A0ABW7AU59_9ACTN